MVVNKTKGIYRKRDKNIFKKYLDTFSYIN